MNNAAAGNIAHYLRRGAPFQLVAILTFILRRLFFPPTTHPFLALGLLGVGLSLFLSCLYLLYIRPQATAHLITTGPFRFTRHPMYIGFILIDLTAFLRPPTPALFASAVIFYSTLSIAAYWQEKETLARFGASATTYYNRTPPTPWHSRPDHTP